MARAGATKAPSTRGEIAAFVLALVASIAGQALQNISLPLALSSGADMGVILTYTAFIFFCFFTLADVVMDALLPPEQTITLSMNYRGLCVVGLENALNGAGAVFGGSSTRTPLTMQMAFFLVANLFAPFYKILRHEGFAKFTTVLRYVGRGWGYYAAAASAYFLSMILVLIDKIHHGASDGNALSPYCIFFVVGTLLGMMYNVDQDKVMQHTRTYADHVKDPVEHDKLTFIQYLKRDVMVLRTQTTWLFIWSWVGTIMSVVGASQSGKLTQSTFEMSWAEFLPFGNTWMDLFNLGYVLTFFGNIYLNRYDSAFTMIINNVSAVSSMWTGWVPSIMMQTVGFQPSVPLTISAMVLSLVAIFPSWRFSHAFKDAMEGYEVEREELIQSERDRSGYEQGIVVQSTYAKY